MEIYFEFIKKHLDLEKEKNHFQFFSLLTLFFNAFFRKPYSIKEKYIFLGNWYNNIFLTPECKMEFLTFFSKIQKTYFAFLRFKFRILLKKSKLIVENDLSLNPISEKDKLVIVIQQKLNKYLFHIRDLLNIIHSSIGHSDFFFSVPISIKNPYNNSVFTKSILYHIYFFVKFNTNYYSELFHRFFLCNFHLSEFYSKNANLLRTYALNDYFKNSSEENWLIDIEEMLEDFNDDHPNSPIKIDNNFPNKKLIEIMKPYLNLYLLGKYSYYYNEKIISQRQLKNKLNEFSTFNPNFGRKIIKINNQFKIKDSAFDFLSIPFESSNPLNHETSNPSSTLNKNTNNTISNKSKEVEILFDENHISFLEKKKNNDNFLSSHAYLKPE